MKTRNQAKRQRQSSDEHDMIRELGHDTKANGSGTLANTSQEVVNKFLKRVGSRGSRGLKKQDSYICNCGSTSKLESGSKGREKQVKADSGAENTLGVEGSSGHAILENSSRLNADGGSLQQAKYELEDVMDDLDWEDGSNESNPIFDFGSNHPDHINKGVTIDFDAAPSTAKRKPVRRASPEEKEVAELVHRTHLLCLLGRGRLIDSACNDPLIQASLLSLLPAHLLKISEITNLTVDALSPLVNWFHSNFHVRSSSSDRSFHSALAGALETREGSPEEVAALSVALFRALNLLTRFVSILDVASLKPDAEKSEDMCQSETKAGKGVFDSSTVMVTRPNKAYTSSGKQSAPVDMENVAYFDKKNASEDLAKASYPRKVKKSGQIICQDIDSSIGDPLNERRVDSLASLAQNASSDACLSRTSEASKRKGDIEFEMQMEMAFSATAAGTSEFRLDTDVKSLHSSTLDFSPSKKLKKISHEESSSGSQGISTAVGSRKIGAPMYWAEIYCNGENSAGKWVHVDAVNAIIDGEQQVEAAAAACKTSLRYVVAFAGQGAKDVTRRYCAKWYKIASQRVSSTWWDVVLAPLKELESRATGGTSRLSDKSSVSVIREDNMKNQERTSVASSYVGTRASLEDMELETKALTEPLPTNQQAYRAHHLYALERWLTKYQILHPKGPVLGFCSGHPVYPRTCVQMLHTKERWLQEGLQLKANELPVKVVKRSVRINKGKVPGADEDDESDCVGPGGTINLYGKWQTEPLCLPPAENGIVPKNERGQVDVWSEKCLPPGTVHLGLPRIFAIAKKLEIDYAPAMVGFEFRNGRSVPVYNGIVVCTEFKDTILEAYAEEEERRGAEERRKNEAQAISRWYQLLSSIITRQRLNNRYAQEAPSHPSNNIQKKNDGSHEHTSNMDVQKKPASHHADEDASQPDGLPLIFEEDHEHVFLTDDRGLSPKGSTQTKRCRCGFSIEVEEM